jgi:hypothetical protein
VTWISVPDMHPGRCLNHRTEWRNGEPVSMRCIEYEAVEHVCTFVPPEPVTLGTNLNTYTTTMRVEGLNELKADLIERRSDDVLAINKWTTNGHLIADVARLGYLRPEWVTLDPTYGYGTFWQQWQPNNLLRCDIDPTKAPDCTVDFTDLPLMDRAFDAVVFDPPYKLNGNPSNTGGMDERFGVHEHRTWQERMALIRAGAVECARVADKMLLVKCQDQVVSGKIRWQSRAICDVVEPLGFGLRDRFEYLSRREQPGGRRQLTARRCSSQLLVFERGWKWSDLDG